MQNRGGSYTKGMVHLDNVRRPQNIGNLLIMEGGLLLPQGLNNLAGSGGISQFAMNTLQLHVSECLQLSSQAEGAFIGS
eukprot:2780673-Ditylum_brightwellii.AAC.1